MSLSKIEWCDYTFNPWWGCSRISSGCRHCYADTLATRWGHELWRRHGPRRTMSDPYWREPLKWNRTAPGRVFCGSMCDVFEAHHEPDVASVLDSQRARLWELIAATPHLTWLLLTKRPQNIAGMVPWGDIWPRNVWIGTSVEHQRAAEERIPILLDIPADIRFLSCEPLVEAVNLEEVDGVNVLDRDDTGHDDGLFWWPGPVIDWVIVGAESGRNARPMDLGWARSLVEQCRASRDTSVFVKQLGSVWAREHGTDSKGGDPQFWPVDLQIREFPAVAVTP